MQETMVRLHPGSLEVGTVRKCLRSHTVVVRRKTGFESRTDLCGESEARGSELIERDGSNGLLVQREDVWLATRKSGFDSPAVHSIQTG